ncbi:hypothetical protein, partial [Mesorhizobium sp. LNJC372A00]|uniref:hypothetical protein n=1 Tax=Mesorhizobium sp. LNJC372A00 TaxID=1287256 RepID=UPI001AEBD9F0
CDIAGANHHESANFSPCQSYLSAYALEGEMSPKATEGVAARGALTFIGRKGGASSRTDPSGLPAISPSRGVICSVVAIITTENFPLTST